MPRGCTSVVRSLTQWAQHSIHTALPQKFHLTYLLHLLPLLPKILQLGAHIGPIKKKKNLFVFYLKKRQKTQINIKADNFI